MLYKLRQHCTIASEGPLRAYFNFPRPGRLISMLHGAKRVRSRCKEYHLRVDVVIL